MYPPAGKGDYCIHRGLLGAISEFCLPHLSPVVKQWLLRLTQLSERPRLWQASFPAELRARAGLREFSGLPWCPGLCCSAAAVSISTVSFPLVLSSLFSVREPGNSHCEEGESVLLGKEAGRHCQGWPGLIPLQLATATLWDPRLFSDFAATACTTPPSPLPTVFSGSLKTPVFSQAAKKLHSNE